MIIGLSLRIFSLLAIVTQAALLDWYLVKYGGSEEWLAWIVADVIVLGVFIASYVYADIYFQQYNFEKLRHQPGEPGEPREPAEAAPSEGRQRQFREWAAKTKAANAQTEEGIRLESGTNNDAGRHRRECKIEKSKKNQSKKEGRNTFCTEKDSLRERRI